MWNTVNTPVKLLYSIHIPNIGTFQITHRNSKQESKHHIQEYGKAIQINKNEWPES